MQCNFTACTCKSCQAVFLTKQPGNKSSVSYYNLLLACIFKTDYTAIGGYNGTLYSVELFERATKSHLDVMQAPDSSLFHVWSFKTCGQLTSNSTRHSSLLPYTRAWEWRHFDLAGMYVTVVYSGNLICEFLLYFCITHIVLSHNNSYLVMITQNHNYNEWVECHYVHDVYSQ